MSPTEASPPTKYAVVLFDGFQALDAFGPLDILNILSRDHQPDISLAVIAPTHSPVSTIPPGSGLAVGQQIVPTHSLDDAPTDIEVLLVPGGLGTRNPEATQRVVDFVAAAFPKLRHLLTVCTGAALAARAGVLGGRRATSNKRSFDWVKTQRTGDEVEWVPDARWVADGKVWTSSGISAGIDMMYAFVAAQYGEDVAAQIARVSEYTRNLDPNDDPFAVSA